MINQSTAYGQLHAGNSSQNCKIELKDVPELERILEQLNSVVYSLEEKCTTISSALARLNTHPNLTGNEANSASKVSSLPSALERLNGIIERLHSLNVGYNNIQSALEKIV